jgi:hypothetical protein
MHLACIVLQLRASWYIPLINTISTVHDGESAKLIVEARPSRIKLEMERSGASSLSHHASNNNRSITTLSLSALVKCTSSTSL